LNQLKEEGKIIKEEDPHGEEIDDNSDSQSETESEVIVFISDKGRNQVIENYLINTNFRSAHKKMSNPVRVKIKICKRMLIMRRMRLLN
jgi:hypothetical protein